MSDESITPPSKFSSFIKGKCPRCRKGDMFVNSLFSFTPVKMHKNCSHCALTFEKEPGYFYAAMYVSYGFTVAELIAFTLLIFFITGSESPWTYLMTITAVIVLLSPFNFRYSRIVLLYFMTPSFRFQEDFFLRGKSYYYEVDKDSIIE